MPRFNTVVFAGGGNRCLWQAGFVSRLSEQGLALPSQLIGTSAGAAVAAAYIVNALPEALQSCVSLYRQTAAFFQWKALRPFRVEFAHRHMDPAWIRSFMPGPSFEALRRSKVRLTIAVTHPIRGIGPALSISLANLTYLLDRKLWQSIHPRLPRYLGLRQAFYSLHECVTLEEVHDLLCAAAAAPPVMLPVKVKGLYAFDGGYTDSAPITAQSASEKAATLVLLTRHSSRRPTLFQHGARTYLQPSRPVPVSTWDCTARATVMDAFNLGRDDADRTELDVLKRRMVG